MKRMKVKKLVKSLRWDQKVTMIWAFPSGFDEKHRLVKFECQGRPRDIADFCKKVGIWNDGQVFGVKTNETPGVIEVWVVAG